MSCSRTFVRDTLSVAKSIGQHFITPRIESVIAKYDPRCPFSASSKAVLIDTATSLQYNKATISIIYNK